MPHFYISSKRLPQITIFKVTSLYVYALFKPLHSQCLTNLINTNVKIKAPGVE